MTLHGEVAGIGHRHSAVAQDEPEPGTVVVKDTGIAHEGAFAGRDNVLIA